MLFYPIHPAVRNAHRPPYGYTMYGNIPFRDLVRGPILKDTLAVYARYARTPLVHPKGWGEGHPFGCGEVDPWGIPPRASRARRGTGW